MNNLIKVHLYGKAPVPPLWHRNKNLLLNRLYVIYGGSGHYLFNKKQFNFKVGHLYLFPCNLDVDFYVNAEDPLEHLFFDFYITPDILLSEPVDIPLKDYPILQSYIGVFETLFSEYNIVNVLGSYEPIHGFVNTLKKDLDNILFYINEITPLYQVYDKRINTAISYIHKHYHEKISIKDLAKLIYTDENNFIKLFKKVTSKTPYQYLRDYRFTIAISLLETGTPVNEVAEKIGYDSIFAFSNAIKKRLGLYPSEFYSPPEEH